MYSFEMLREIWIWVSCEEGKYCYEWIKYYFSYFFDCYLKEMIFVVVYDFDYNVGIFLDYKGYIFFKEKIDKVVEMIKNLFDVELVKLFWKIL